MKGKKIEKKIRRIVNNMKKGDKINYWYDIADRFDELDEEGNTDYNIVEKYDEILEKLVDEGLIKYKKDEDGNDNIIVKIK